MIPGDGEEGGPQPCCVMLDLALASSGTSRLASVMAEKLSVTQRAGQSAFGAGPPLSSVLFPFHFGSCSEKKAKVPLFKGD